EIQRQRAEYPRYSNFYLSYKDLKQAIRTFDEAKARLGGEASSSGAAIGEHAFSELLRRQLDKVNNCVELQWEVITGELRARQRANSAVGSQALGKLGQ
ncbi:unnamed protein product, partial [Polarella glacialis]